MIADVIGSLCVLVVPLALLSIPVALVGSVWLLDSYLKSQNRLRTTRAFRAVVQDLGLEGHDDIAWGTLDGRPVHVKTESTTDDRGQPVAWTVLQFAEMPDDVTVARGPPGSAPLPTGDKAFDRTYHPAGPPSALALLDATTRQAFRDARCDVALIDGQLTLTREGALTNPVTLRLFVDRGRAIAAALADGAPRPQRLCQAAEGEEDREVRLSMLRGLIAAFPDQSGGPADRALRSRDPSFQLIGAIHHRSTPALLSLIRRDDEPQIRARALRALSRLGDHRGLAQGLALAADAPVPELSYALLDIIARLAPPSGPECLARLLEALHRQGDHRSTGTVMRAATVAAECGDARSERPLLALLDGTASEVHAAAAALGRLGTVDAVPTLRAFHDEASALSGLRGPVQQAIHAVQARAGGERGRMAIVAPSPGSGALSEATHRSGALSPTED